MPHHLYSSVEGVSDRPSSRHGGDKASCRLQAEEGIELLQAGWLSSWNLDCGYLEYRRLLSAYVVKKWQDRVCI